MDVRISACLILVVLMLCSTGVNIIKIVRSGMRDHRGPSVKKETSEKLKEE